MLPELPSNEQMNRMCATRPKKYTDFGALRAQNCLVCLFVAAFRILCKVFDIQYQRSSGLGFQFSQVVPFCAQHGLAVAAQPTVELSSIDAAEVGVELEVVGVEIRQTGVLADDAPLDRRPGDEQARGSAVVGAPAAVLRNATAELRESHQPHPTVVTAGL